MADKLDTDFNFPKLKDVFLLFFIVVFLYIASAVLFMKKLGLSSLLISQWFGIGIPSIYFLYSYKNQIFYAPLKKRPSINAICSIILSSSSLWYVLVSTLLPLQEHFFPTPESFLKDRQDLLSIPSSNFYEWFLLWIKTALTPAIWEEILFRGILLPSFMFSRVMKKSSLPYAMILSSLMFALFHFNPYQIAVTFFMGLCLAYCVVSTGSLYSSMLFHMINNTFVLIVSSSNETEIKFNTLYFSISLVFTLLGMLNLYFIKAKTKLLM